jgi:hypothetical protein
VEVSLSKGSVIRLFVAPALDCFPLLDVLVEKGSVRTKVEVVSLELSEPPDSAFKIPEGYREVSPLEFDALWRERFNGRPYFSAQEATRFEFLYQRGKARSKKQVVRE